LEWLFVVLPACDVAGEVAPLAGVDESAAGVVGNETGVPLSSLALWADGASMGTGFAAWPGRPGKLDCLFKLGGPFGLDDTAGALAGCGITST